MAGYLVGSLSLLTVFLGLRPWHATCLGLLEYVCVVLFVFAAPWVQGVVTASVQKFLFKLSFWETFSISGSSWWCAPLLLAGATPWLRDLHLLVFFLGFVFAISFLVFPAVKLWPLTRPVFTERFRIGFLLVSFLPGLFLLFQACIFHDALWTYGYLRSALLDHDLNFYNEFMLHNSYFMYVPHPNDPIFYSGLCIFLLPFFLVAHALAILLENLPSVFVDGYSWPYTFLSNMAGVSAGLGALLVMYKICRQFFQGFSSLMSVMLIFWAGNLVFYTFVWPLYSHAFSVLTVSMFILFWLETRAKRNENQWAVWGAILGLAVWIRPQNVLFGIIPVWEFIRELRASGMQRSCIAVKGIAFVFAALLCFSPQLLLWYKSSGSFVVDAYSRIGDEFFWTTPRFHDLFFSFNKGLFTWTPVFLLAIPGFCLFQRRLPHTAWPLAITFLLQSYLVACYEYPDGGAGFGSRYLIDCMPFLALCLVALIEVLQTRARPSVITAAACLFIYINLSMVIMYSQEIIPHNEYTPSAGELADHLIFRVPQAVDDYIFSSHINENVFVRPFLSALIRADWKKLVLTSTAYATACLWLFLVLLLVVRSRPWKESLAKHLIWSIAVLFSLLDYGIIFLKPTVPYRHIYPVLRVAYERQEAPSALDAREFFLDPVHEHQEIDITFNSFIRFLDLTTTVVHALDIPSGATLATMTLIDSWGGRESFSIVMGRDTAEYSYFVDPSKVHVTHPEMGKARVVHHWLTRDEENGYYYGSGYLCRYHFRFPRLATKISFRYVFPRGRLIVTGINLVSP